MGGNRQGSHTGGSGGSEGRGQVNHISSNCSKDGTLRGSIFFGNQGDGFQPANKKLPQFARTLAVLYCSQQDLICCPPYLRLSNA
jgi:hypothetical protein